MFQHNSRLVIIGLMVISTLVFAAPQSVVVLSPNGGEIWAAGSTQMITWNYTGQAEARSFTVYLSIDGGKTFNPITRELP